MTPDELPPDPTPASPTDELACGTGVWTRELAGRGRSLIALDASPEMLARARKRREGRPVTFVCADVLAWRPPRRYDVIFFAAWLSHVPPQRFDMLGDALAPGGRVLCIDDTPSAAAHDTFVPGAGIPIVHRRLQTGERFRAVKVLWSGADLSLRLRAGLDGGDHARRRALLLPDRDSLTVTASPAGTGGPGVASRHRG